MFRSWKKKFPIQYRKFSSSYYRKKKTKQTVLTAAKAGYYRFVKLYFSLFFSVSAAKNQASRPHRGKSRLPFYRLCERLRQWTRYWRSIATIIQGRSCPKIWFVVALRIKNIVIIDNSILLKLCFCSLFLQICLFKQNYGILIIVRNM